MKNLVEDRSGARRLVKELDCAAGKAIQDHSFQTEREIERLKAENEGFISGVDFMQSIILSYFKD